MRQWAARSVGRLCWLYALGTAVVFLTMRLGGERWWVATLLLFWPRWVWLVPLAVLLPMTLLLRRRMTIVALACGIIILCGIMGFRVPWRNLLTRAPQGTPLCILTCNIHGTETDPDVLNRFVAQTHPDLILLQDYGSEREPAIVKAEGWHSDQWGGSFIASRHPIHRISGLLPQDDEARAYSAHGWPLGEAFCYQVDLPSGPVRIVNLHLASPHQQLQLLRENVSAGAAPLQADSARRTFESTKVEAYVHSIGGPFILAGDFNTPDDSPLFQHVWWNFNDAFNVAGWGFGATYAKHHTWLRIDHVLYNDGWHCTECQVGPPIGSGHRPVAATLVR